MEWAWIIFLVLYFAASFVLVWRFWKTEYFLFFLVSALLETASLTLSLWLHIQTFFLFPFIAGIMLLIFLNNKYRVIVAFILFSVSLLTKYFPAYYFIPFLTTSSALFFLLLYFLKQIVKEINTTAYLRLFLVVQALQTICNILRVYFYYEHPALFINCSTYFLAFTSLSILLNIYFGYNKKVFIAGRKMESVPVVSLDKEEEFLKDLKDREIEVLYYLSQGLDEQEAAEKMALGIKSIYNYIAILKEKLDLKHIMAISHFAAVNREKIAKRHNCIKKQ